MEALGATMNVRYRVTLTSAERKQLEELVSGGKAAVRKIKRAQKYLGCRNKRKRGKKS